MFYGKKKMLIILCILFVVIAIGLIKFSGLKTIEVQNTNLDQGISTQAYLILDEELIYINNSKSLEYDIKEGTKVSLNSIIGKSNSLVYENQDALSLEIINWKLENGMAQNNNSFHMDLEKINNQIKKIDKELDHQKDKKEAKRLKSKKKDLIHKKRIIEGSFRFAFSDMQTLNKIKKEIEDKEGQIQGQITLKKLGVNKPGIVFFKKDGFENILHKDLLRNITPTYFEEIEKYISSNEELESPHSQVLKVVDDNHMYLITKVPKNSFQGEEDRLEKTLESIGSTWKQEHHNIISFIENRKDILMLFPSIQMEYHDFLVNGFLIDIRNDSHGIEKILTIKLDSNNHQLASERVLEDVYIFDNRYNGYILPKESIIKKDNVYGVIMLGKANEELFMEVKISEELEEHVVLDPEENLNIKHGSKILAKP